MVAIGAGAPIALAASGGVVDWIMLVPIGAGGIVPTVDGRGPYRVTNAAKLAAESLHAAGGRIPIDENHATDLAAPKGEPSPARGWATELQARADGIWGRVEWSTPGAALMVDKAYRFISPALMHDKAGNVLGVLRASLTNTPNLLGMAALHSEESNMDLLAQLRALLGLADDADEAAVLAKITELKAPATALNASEGLLAQLRTLLGLADDADVAAVVAKITELAGTPADAAPALASIAKAVGLKPGATATALASAVTALAAGTGPVIVALQGELTAVTTSLNALLKDKSAAYVDGEIAKGRVGVKPMRDTYISMHAANPVETEKLIGAMPILGASGALQTAPVGKDGKTSLNSEQSAAAKMLGIKPEDYAKTLAAEQSGAA